jgi:threonine dehydratase
MSTSTWPISLDDVERARERLRPHLSPSPLRNYPALDQELGCRVLVKHENHQPTNSFKVRNGLAVLTALSAEERARGVVAATRGNHGLGLAHAGRALGVPVTICVPEGNNPEKNEAIRGYGAELVVEGRDYDVSVQVMNRLVSERDLRAVHSTNEPLVIAGAGTLTAEVVEQAEALGQAPAAMVVAVGGGSQAVGAMTVLRARLPAVKVYGAQAAAAPAIHDSWRAGRPLETASADTFADGVATRMSYEVTFGALRQGLEDFVTVTEAEIAAAVRRYLRTTHNLAEGAGAVGLAGLKQLAGRLQGQTVVVVLSGSNIDQTTLLRVLHGEL